MSCLLSSRQRRHHSPLSEFVAHLDFAQSQFYSRLRQQLVVSNKTLNPRRSQSAQAYTASPGISPGPNAIPTSPSTKQTNADFGTRHKGLSSMLSFGQCLPPRHALAGCRPVTRPLTCRRLNPPHCVCRLYIRTGTNRRPSSRVSLAPAIPPF